VGGNLARKELISVGVANFLVKVDLMWVHDLGSSLKSSRRLSTNTLNIVCRERAMQNIIITHINFIGNFILGFRKLLWLIQIGLFSVVHEPLTNVIKVLYEFCEPSKLVHDFFEPT
jgi:hypothetical protein